MTTSNKQQATSNKQQAEISCPVCTRPAGSYCLEVNTFKIFKCSNCGLEHTYPIPSAQQLSDYYESYTDIRAVSDVIKLNAERNLKTLEKFGYTTKMAVLDFGTGDAAFVKTAGQNCFGIDFKKSQTERVYQKISDLPIASFDFITMWGVLEHLEDPVSTVKGLEKMLKMGGKLVITTVDTEGIIPYYYKPVEHLTYWTRNSFNALFEKCSLGLSAYQPYIMQQRSEIYLDRLLSRTPGEYREAFKLALNALPEYVEIPTNEVFVVAVKYDNKVASPQTDM